MRKIELKNGIMHFTGCSIPFPDTPGLHIVSSGCGSGKTTMIREIIREKWKAGILVVTSTINAAEELGQDIESWINTFYSFPRPLLRILHSDTRRIREMEAYKSNPESLGKYEILIITSARIIIDPYELFLSYESGKRGYILIDEMINYYPQPFDIPREMKDIVTFVDRHKTHQGKRGTDCGNGIYRHCYQNVEEMWAAYNGSGYRLFKTGNPLVRYKTEYIFRHIQKHGLVPMRGKLKDYADKSCCILFDGTADCLFKDTDPRLLPAAGNRYCSDIEFSQFDLPFKRKNKEDWNKGTLMKTGKGVLDMIKALSDSGKTLIVTWKSLDIFREKKNTGEADYYEQADSKVQYNFPKLLEECLTESGVIPGNISIIYRGSGQDRGSNEYRDYQNIVFLGEWHIPDNIVGDINGMFGCKCSFKDYMKSLVIQTICRIRIRQHSGLSVKVCFSSDIDYNLMSDVQEYFRENSPGSCRIEGIKRPCKKYSKPEKKLMMDIVLLYAYDSRIRDSIKNGTPYSFTITLDELYKRIPKPRKAKDRYKDYVRFLGNKGITMNIS